MERGEQHMPVTALQQRRTQRKRVALAFFAVSTFALIGSGGVAFAAKDAPSWTRTTQLTVRVETDEPQQSEAPIAKTTPPSASASATNSAATAETEPLSPAPTQVEESKATANPTELERSMTTQPEETPPPNESPSASETREVSSIWSDPTVTSDSPSPTGSQG
jgi:hypothetical protein